VTTVSAISVTPSSGSGLQQMFALHYADPAGATDLATVWVSFTSNLNTASAVSSCEAYYSRAANQLYPNNDAGTSWYSPATLRFVSRLRPDGPSVWRWIR
jgi:hypothetical protein